MENKKSIGLPSGPNEFLKEITQHISVEGYKRYSEDVNNPYNIIESGNITMEDVDFPVMGTDNLGNSQIMMPGMNYQFPGDQVFEVPMAQGGIEVPKRKGVRLNYDAEGNVIGESTHIMKAEIVDGKWYGFPTLFQNDDNTWDNTFELLINENERNWMPAFKEAKRRGELIEFGDDMESAIKFGEGSWKPKAQDGGEEKESFLDYSKRKLLRSLNPFAKVDDTLQALGIPANVIREGIEGVSGYFGDEGGYGDGKFNWKNIIPDIENTSILDDTEAQKPVSEVLEIEGWKKKLLVDMATDPSSYVGAGVVKNLVKKGATTGIPKVLKSLLPKLKNSGIKSSDEVIEMVEDLFGNKIKKSTAVKLNRFEDANVTNTTFGKLNPDGSMPYETGNWFQSKVDPFYLNMTKKAGSGDLLNQDSNRRLLTTYLNPEDAKKFNILNMDPSTSAYQLSGGRGNLPIPTEYVIPPPLVARLRDAGKVGQPKELMTSLIDFYKMYGGGLPKAQIGRGLIKEAMEQGAKQIDNFLPSLQRIFDDVISNAYKYNPNAFQNINSKLPKFLQLNKGENKNWLRQVGKEAIDDAQLNRVVREKDEIINKNLFNEKLKSLMDQQTGTGFSLDKRYRGPFFKRGELFFDYNKKSRPGLEGMRNTKGKSGSADYLIETNFGGKKADWFFQPAYLQKMTVDPKPFSKLKGDIAIMKPWRRESDNFNFYKKDWWEGYKKTPLDELQPGGEYKVQRGDTFYGIANKNNVSWNDLKKANPNVNIESLGLNQNIIIPKSIDSSSNMQKSEQSKNSNILNYDTLSNYLVETRGGTIDTWGQLADTVAFHEAGSEQRGNPKARQISQRADGTFYDGPGRGVFQFEDESFKTALKRYKNIASSQGYSLKDDIVNATSADQLSLEDQYAVFLANLIESKAKLSDFADGNSSSLDVWLSGHKNVEAKGNRDSFLESENAAKKEGIKNGYKTFEEGGDINYTVAEGDNLSKIARKYNTSVDDIVRLNDILDPNQISINQELIIPESTKPANITNSYNVRPGDTLGRIAKTYNTTAKNLAKYNDIEDMNMIKVNQQIAIPDNIRKLVDEPVPTWNPVDSYLEQTNETNALSDEKIIIQSQMLNNPNQSYVIIDKTTNQLKVLNGEDEALSFEVLTGKNSGDSQTVTKMNDINGDGRINDKDKVNGNWQTNWDRSNLSTGAGRFEISASSPTSTDQYQNAPSWNLINDNGIEVATAIHGTTNYRKQFFGDDNVENNRASNGCINGQCTDLDALYDLDLPIGTPIFILPEDKGNNFILQDGKAIFKASNKNRQNALSYINSLGEEESGQGINYTSNSLTYKQIRAKFNKEKFKKDIFTDFDFNDEEELENSTLPFIQALQDNKKAIMLKAQIPGDVYNQIAKMAFGIYGTESNFGDTHSAAGNLVRAANKKSRSLINEAADYYEEDLRLVSDGSAPDVLSKYYTYGLDKDYRSAGYTQVRWSQLNDKEKSALKSFDITSNEDFLDPKKSAIATATILGIRYNEQLTADEKKNVWKHLPGKWNNRGNYTKRVKKNSAYLDFEQLGVLNKGGEIENHIMYKNYINGIYKGSKMQSKAEKVYDKLNRLHYRDAKAKQMTPANYVLSEIIG